MPDIRDFRDLTPDQQSFLERFEREPELVRVFYFTGGTLLKALGVVPRESNDLDFFTFPTVDEREYLRALGAVKTLLHSIVVNGEIVETDRGFLLPTKNMRLEYVYDAVRAIDKFIPFGQLKASGLRDLAANKAAAFCVRDELRDYVDIALLTAKEGWTLADLAAIAEEKFSLGTISEAKLLTELLNKQKQFAPCPTAIFLRNQRENAANVDRQVDFLLTGTTL